jgi:hypothetical protein
MHTKSFAAATITRSYRQTIDAAPDVVFPLLCPVREAEWLDGWQYTMLHSESGLVEEGAVFSTPGDGEADTVWIVTRHDPADRAVEFTRFTSESRLCVLRICVTPDQPARSLVDISYRYVALTPAGDAFLERLTEESFRDAMTFWEASMNHWLATGTRLAKRDRP